MQDAGVCIKDGMAQGVDVVDQILIIPWDIDLPGLLQNVQYYNSVTVEISFDSHRNVRKDRYHMGLSWAIHFLCL